MNAINESALVKRINRRLPREQRLRKTRVERFRMEFELGDYYVRDLSRNLVLDVWGDPEELGKRVGTYLLTSPMMGEVELEQENDRSGSRNIG